MNEEVLNTIMWLGVTMCFMIVGHIIAPPLEAIGIDEQLTWFILGSWWGVFIHDNNLNRNNQNKH